MGEWRNGSRAILKILSLNRGAGSIPALPTKIENASIAAVLWRVLIKHGLKVQLFLLAPIK